jgi:hypothetical protein
LHQRFPTATFYDLLNIERKTALLLRPAQLREEVLARQDKLVVIDEVQKSSKRQHASDLQLRQSWKRLRPVESEDPVDSLQITGVAGDQHRAIFATTMGD